MEVNQRWGAGPRRLVDLGGRIAKKRGCGNVAKRSVGKRRVRDARDGCGDAKSTGGFVPLPDAEEAIDDGAGGFGVASNAKGDDGAAAADSIDEGVARLGGAHAGDIDQVDAGAHDGFGVLSDVRMVGEVGTNG